MVNIVKGLIRGLLVSLVSCLVFAGGMYVIASVRFLSHATPTSLLLLCIPLFIFSLRQKFTSVKELLLSTITTSLWIVVPVSFLIGWFFSTFQFNEFDPNKVFNLNEFLLFSSLPLIPFFVITFITLLSGGGIRLLVLEGRVNK